jgi:hypothetical protein
MKFYDTVAGVVEHIVYLVITIFTAIPGVWHIEVFTRIKGVHQQIHFCGVIGFAGNVPHIPDHVICHGIYDIELLEITGGEGPGSLVADIYAVEPGHFL